MLPFLVTVMPAAGVPAGTEFFVRVEVPGTVWVKSESNVAMMSRGPRSCQ